MGAVCGKEDHFESLGTGQKVGSGNGLARQPTPHQPRQKPIPRPQTQGQTLGGKADSSVASGAGGPDREAMLRAAEARSKAAETRGTSKGGSLSKKLEQQKKDGGRKDEAQLEAERRGNEPLVWD